MDPGLIFSLPLHFFLHLCNLFFFCELFHLLRRRSICSVSLELAEYAIIVACTDLAGLSEGASSLQFSDHLITGILFHFKCLARFLDVLHLLFYFMINFHDILLLLNIIRDLSSTLPHQLSPFLPFSSSLIFQSFDGEFLALDFDIIVIRGLTLCVSRDRALDVIL